MLNKHFQHCMISIDYLSCKNCLSANRDLANYWPRYCTSNFVWFSWLECRNRSRKDNATTLNSQRNVRQNDCSDWNDIGLVEYGHENHVLCRPLSPHSSFSQSVLSLFCINYIPTLNPFQYTIGCQIMCCCTLRLYESTPIVFRFPPSPSKNYETNKTK